MTRSVEEIQSFEPHWPSGPATLMEQTTSPWLTTGTAMDTDPGSSSPRESTYPEDRICGMEAKICSRPRVFGGEPGHRSGEHLVHDLGRRPGQQQALSGTRMEGQQFVDGERVLQGLVGFDPPKAHGLGANAHDHDGGFPDLVHDFPQDGVSDLGQIGLGLVLAGDPEQDLPGPVVPFFLDDEVLFTQRPEVPVGGAGGNAELAGHRVDRDIPVGGDLGQDAQTPFK